MISIEIVRQYRKESFSWLNEARNGPQPGKDNLTLCWCLLCDPLVLLIWRRCIVANGTQQPCRNSRMPHDQVQSVRNEADGTWWSSGGPGSEGGSRSREAMIAA